MAALPGFLKSVAASALAQLALPPSATVSVAAVTDTATGAVVRLPPARRALGASGSGVAVTLDVNVGKVPSQALLQNLTASVASPAFASSFGGAVAAALTTAAGLPAGSVAASVSAPLVANSLFVVAPPPPEAGGGGDGGGGASGAGGAAIGGGVGGGIVACALAVWTACSWRRRSTSWRSSLIDCSGGVCALAMDAGRETKASEATMAAVCVRRMVAGSYADPDRRFPRRPRWDCE
jgi:hypothetical protein